VKRIGDFGTKTMDSSLQWLGPFLHWLTLAILFLLPLLAAFVLYKLGGLPGAIARARGHPHADAIGICGWMGVITVVLWPVALVWAYLPCGRLEGAAGVSTHETDTLIAGLQAASRRLEALEGRLAQR
jgi:hypothetical protein